MSTIKVQTQTVDVKPLESHNRSHSKETTKRSHSYFNSTTLNSTQLKNIDQQANKPIKHTDTKSLKKPNRNKSSEIGKQLESANKVVTASKVPKKQNDSRTSSCHSEVRNYKSHLKSSSRTVSMHKIPTAQTILNKSTNGHTRVKSRVMPETTQDTEIGRAHV